MFIRERGRECLNSRKSVTDESEKEDAYSCLCVEYCRKKPEKRNPSFFVLFEEVRQAFDLNHQSLEFHPSVTFQKISLLTKSELN